MIWLAIALCGLGRPASPTDRGAPATLNPATVSSTAFPDLSFLNSADRPAGGHGPLRTHGSELVFADGTVTRFWGTNLSASAVFDSSKIEAQYQAKRLASLGVNLVRLHHLDSAWVNPNIFGPPGASSTSNLNAAALDKIDWWISCLAAEGIYIWLDLHVGRQLKATDGIDAFAEIAHGDPPAANLVGYNYVNDSIRAAMKRFDEQLLMHENPYRKHRYRDDPAIAIALITNENDLTTHYGNALLPDKDVPQHSALFLKQAADFARVNQLPQDQVWRAWQNGPSKLFLNDIEKRFDVDMMDHLHGLGVHVPIATTNSWGDDSLVSLPALAAGDIIDTHSYAGSRELDRNPFELPNVMHWIAAAQVPDKPLTVSEWGIDRDHALADDRQDLPLYIASYGALQGWRAILNYGYAQEPFTDRKPSVYEIYNDPKMLASMAAAALLFRRHHVSESSTTYVYVPGREIFYRPASAATSVALRTAAERGRLLIAMPPTAELPWLKASPIPAGVGVFSDPNRPLAPVNASPIVSDTGELSHDWKAGFFSINTPRTQAIMGRLCCRTISLGDVHMELRGSDGLLAVQSLDEHAIHDSSRLLVSASGDVAPAQIGVRAQRGLTWLAPDESRQRLIPRSIPYVDGRYRVVLDRNTPFQYLVGTLPPIKKLATRAPILH